MSDLDKTQASIVATMLLFPEEVEKIGEAVREEWFTGDYRKAFAYLSENGGSDAIALAEAIGVSLGTINEWITLEFTTAFLPQHYANLERDAAIRKIQYLGHQLLKVQDVESASKLIERFSTSTEGRDKTEPLPIKKGISRLMKEIERRHSLKGQILGMTYGISDLDAVTEGMHRGDLIVVAGSSSMGKTAFALGVAESAAAVGNKVLVFSCEMTTEQLLMRSLASHSGVPLSLVRASYRLRESDWPRLTNSLGAMSNWHMEIDDPAGISLAELTRKVRKAKRSGLDLVVVDYLQIMRYDKSKEVQELDTITTNLKNLAKELQVCIILLSQLNRTSEKEKRKPTMSDLRGSGMIENNADVILFPFREAANCQKCQERDDSGGHNTSLHQSKAEIIIGKQRQGERNISVKVVWIGERTRFAAIAKD